MKKRLLLSVSTLPLAVSIGFFLYSILPEELFSVIHFNYFWVLEIAFILILPIAIGFYFLSRKEICFPASLKGGILLGSGIIVSLMLGVMIVIGTVVAFGERGCSKSPVISEIDFCAGKSRSFLQHFDEAGYSSGKSMISSFSTQNKEHCLSKDQFQEIDCERAGIKHTNKCLYCEYQLDTQDQFHCLIVLSENRATEFTSINHNFTEVSPLKLKKYFALPQQLLELLSP